jgi:hypothetical protein
MTPDPNDPYTSGPEPRHRFAAGFGAGVLTTAVLAGALWVLTPRERHDIPVAPEPTAVAPTTEAQAPDPVATLQASEARVGELETELATKRAELEALQASADRSDTRVAELEAQIKALDARVSSARSERDDLRERLRVALGVLTDQANQNAVAQRQVVALSKANTENLWAAFTAQAKAEVCDPMSRSAREKCELKVSTFFDAGQHDRFAACVRSNRTAPSLWRADGTGDAPSTAVPLTGISKDWYVLYCDPSLPEASVADNETPPPVITAEGR